MKHVLIVATACTFSLGGIESAAAQAVIVEDDYAAPAYEVAPVVPYYPPPMLVEAAPAYAAPVPSYDATVIRSRPITGEVVVTEPEAVATVPAVTYSAW